MTKEELASRLRGIGYGKLRVEIRESEVTVGNYEPVPLRVLYVSAEPVSPAAKAWCAKHNSQRLAAAVRVQDHAPLEQDWDDFDEDVWTALRDLGNPSR